MKKTIIHYFTTLFLIGIMVMFSSSGAVAQNSMQQHREKIALKRVGQPQKARKSEATPMRVKGGTNSDRQLYAVHCPSYYGSAESGVVEINTSGTYSWVKKFDMPVFAGCYMGDKLFIVHYDAAEPADVKYVYYNTDTWEQSELLTYTLNSPNILPYGLTYDHTSNTVYGSFFADANSWMVTQEAQFGYLTGNMFDPVKIVGELPVRMRAMATDKNGVIYALGFDGNLYTIDKFTAATTLVREIVLPVSDPEADVLNPWDTYGRESMTIDWETNDFYIAYGDDMGDTYVAKFDIVTGEVERVSNFSYTDGSETCDVFTCLYFKQEYQQGGIKPQPVTNLTVTPVGVELKATVNFTAPTLDLDGKPLAGELQWKITDGSIALASGTVTPGDAVEKIVEVAAAGEKTFVVSVSLNGVESNSVFIRKFIGCDTPVIAGKPSVRVNGNKAVIKWSAAEAENGGNLAPVTYRIVRMPDNHVIAEACTDTQIEDVVTSEYKTLYVYEVYPVSGEVTGKKVTSRGDYIGKYIQMPMYEDFADEVMFLQYPVIDNNGDGNIWEINLKRTSAVYQGNNNDADDYLLVGPFKMKKGNNYSFRMTAGGHSIAEYVAVYVGTDPDDVASFDMELLAPAKIVPMEGNLNVSKNFIPTADGDYWFGIKACSEKNSKFLYIENVAVSELDGKLPAAPGDIAAEPTLTTLTLSFTMPSVAIDGSRLESLSEVRIYRDETLVGSITEGVAPGARLSFTDNDEVADGNHYYSVSAVNADGEGRHAEIVQYRGLDIPGRPSKLRLYEDLETPGLIHISFNAPERGFNGGYIDKDDISYIFDYMVAGAGSADCTLGKGTVHSYQLPFETKSQDLLAGSVYGYNAKGSIRSSWTTNICVIGAAINIPMHESWTGMSQKSGLWSGQYIDEKTELFETTWDIVDGSTSTVKPQDNDGGMMSMSTSKENGGRRLLAPRISLKDAKNPLLVFYYHYTADAKNFDVEILVEDQPVSLLENISLESASEGKWIRHEISLSRFVDKKYIQLAFSGRGAVSDNFLSLDNVTISDFVDKDLAVVEFTAPVKCDVNDEIDFALTIRNNGASEVAGNSYKLNLYKNDVLLVEKSGVDISPDSEIDVDFTDTPSVFDPSSVTYYATIEYAEDLNKSNNESRRMPVRIIIPDFPKVSDLKGESKNGVTLSWSDPEMSDIPGNATIESFENYESFIIKNIGDWTLYDRDNRVTAVMALATGVLDYPNIGEKMAWQVIDPTEAGIPLAAWTPRTGSKFLVSFQACIDGYRDVNSDDWLVSPELNASAQTISFYARTATKQYSPEVFDFMVSSTGNNVEDFKALAADVQVPYTGGDEWTEFVYNVPEGTRYFAIVHKTVNQFAMMIDDITFIKAGSAPVSLELNGFNVYRDGKRINSEPVADNGYVDRTAKLDVEYTYAVSVVWDKGESGLSNSVTLKGAEVTAVGEVGYDVVVSGRDGIITIEGAHGDNVEIYTVDGICVARFNSDGRSEVAVPCCGVYVVKVGNSTGKVVVR